VRTVSVEDREADEVVRCDAERARADFLREIGHDQDDHLRDGEDASWRRATWPSSRCGWWWCPLDGRAGAPQFASQWRNLLTALRVLRDKDIEPRGQRVALVGIAFWSTEDLKRDLKGRRELLDRFHDAGTELAESLAHLGDKDIRVAAIKRALAEIEPMRTAARAADAQHGNAKIGLRGSLDEGRAAGWDFPEIAAAMILTGVDRDEHANLVDRLRHLPASTAPRREGSKRR